MLSEGASAHWGIEARREVILDLPEVCYPWKVLAAIQAIQACSPFSSLTGDTGSKNSCQKGFSVIDKPFVSTEAPPLASPNQTSQNLRIGGKTCWAARGIKQQEESESVAVTVDFYKRLCNPRRKSPEGLKVVVLIPSPAHAPPSLCSHCSSSPVYNSPLPGLAFPAFPLLFLSWHQERYFDLLFQTVALWACMLNCWRKGSSSFPTAHFPLTGMLQGRSKVWFQVLILVKSFIPLSSWWVTAKPCAGFQKPGLLLYLCALCFIREMITLVFLWLSVILPPR